MPEETLFPTLEDLAETVSELLESGELEIFYDLDGVLRVQLSAAREGRGQATSLHDRRGRRAG